MSFLIAIATKLGEWLLAKAGAFLFTLAKTWNKRRKIDKVSSEIVKAIEDARDKINETKKKKEPVTKEQIEELRNAQRRMASGFFKR